MSSPLTGIVVRIRGIVLPTAVEADREPALGIVPAKENVGHGRAAFLPRVPGVQQRGYLIEPRHHVHAAASGESDDGVGIGCGHRFDQLVLTPGQAEGAIEAFALGRGVETDGDHRHIRSRRELLHVL